MKKKINATGNASDTGSTGGRDITFNSHITAEDGNMHKSAYHLASFFVLLIQSVWINTWLGSQDFIEK